MDKLLFWGDMMLV